MLLYFGDDDMTRAAAYLCGVLQHFGIPFEHVDSGDPPSPEIADRRYDLYILSDYLRERLDERTIGSICRAVEAGAGLLMIGGWESFHGIGDSGGYCGSLIADMLPVLMEPKDDRFNSPQPVFVRPASGKVDGKEAHPVLAGLPWETPSAVGGFNRFTLKPEAELLLEGAAVAVRREPDGTLRFGAETVYPLLALGRYGQGTTAALAFDLAPHWVGQFVDWGAGRVTQTLRGVDGDEIGFIEVGDAYARFVRQLVDQLRGA